MAFDLKSENDVKDYIENLGIEYRFGCYKEKKPEVCHLLGDYLESIKKDFEKAGKVYKNNCEEAGFGKSCDRIGKYYLTGKGGVQSDELAAYKYFEKGCNTEDAESCLSYGLMRVTPFMNINKYDVTKGMDALKVSCDKGNEKACYFLSGMFITGVKKAELVNDPKHNPHVPSSDPKDYIVPKDMTQAFKYTEMACELKNIYACVNLSQMYARGDGVKQNQELADKFKKTALEMQASVEGNSPEISFQQGLPKTT